MRIPCPFCGPRDAAEFVCRGEIPGGSAGPFEDLYLRENSAGPHREHWLHAGGCRAWLVVTRDTRTHELIDVELAKASV